MEVPTSILDKNANNHVRFAMNYSVFQGNASNITQHSTLVALMMTATSTSETSENVY
jgi:hypothetical protein